MSEERDSPNPPTQVGPISYITKSFVASIAQTLNSRGIPCVLWGHFLLNVHGIPSIVSSIDYIVLDALLGIAIEALAGIQSLAACPDQSVCIASSGEGYTPPGEFHVHIPNVDATVDLYVQSKTLWYLPTLDDSLLFNNSLDLPAHFVLASDQDLIPPIRPARGEGPFDLDSAPVVVPKSHVLLEALIRLWARDSEKRIGAFGVAMISYIEEYVDIEGFLQMDLLPEPFKTFYLELKTGSKPLLQWTEELRAALGISEDSED